MQDSAIAKTAVYYSLALLQGICLILLPAASFIFKTPEMNGISDQQYGLSFFPMNLTAIIAALNFRQLLKQTGPGAVFYAGIFCHAIFLILVGGMGFTIGNNGSSFFLLLTANLFLGAGFGLLTSILNVFIVDLYPERRDTFVTGLHGCLGIGAALAPLAVNFFHEKGSWVESVYWSLAVLILLFIAAHRTHASFLGRKAEKEMVAHLKDPTPLSWGAKLFILTVVFYGVTEAIIGNWSAVYLTQEKGFSSRTAFFALSFFWTFMTVGRIGATFLTLRVDARTLYRFSPFLILAGLWLITWIHAESRILTAYLVVGLGCSCFFPLTISLSTEYFDEWRETLPPLIVAGLMLGVFLGSFLIGFLRDHGLIALNQAFLIASASVALVGILAFLLTFRKPA